MNPKKDPIHRRVGETARRAFAEFLKFPSIIVLGFLLLAACTWFLNHADVGWLLRMRAPIREHFFRDGHATSALLATIAGSIITRSPQRDRESAETIDKALLNDVEKGATNIFFGPSN